VNSVLGTSDHNLCKSHDRHLYSVLWLNRLLVNRPESPFDLQQGCSGVVAFTTVETDFTGHIAYDQLIAVASVYIFHRTFVELAMSTDIAARFTHDHLRRVHGSMNLGGFGT